MVSSKILIVDDELEVQSQLKRYLQAEKYETKEAATGEQALALLNDYNFDVILLDVKLPDVSGIDLLQQLHKNYPDTCVIIMTAFGNSEITKKALRAGAFDFFDKPLRFNTLLPRIDSAIERFLATRERVYFAEEEQRKYTFDNIIGNSAKMVETLNLIKKVANTDATVLILGESGTGKEQVAKAIHYNSHRRNNPWMIADCSTITSSLSESELFGHEKGAFTGAMKRKIGKFERASGGTLFIDEIGELDHPLQMKLLRFLQEGTIERVGGEELIHVDARVIAATAVDLKAAIEKKVFREDLFFRLNVVTINIPPLRDRIDDIPLLVDHFISAYSRKYRKQINSITTHALNLLKNYEFPGNVRELENISQRAIVHTDSNVIKPNAIIFDPINSNHKLFREYFDMPIRKYLVACEKDYLIHLLNKHDWHIINSAKDAEIDRTNLSLKMKKHGLSKKYF